MVEGCADQSLGFCGLIRSSFPSLSFLPLKCFPVNLLSAAFAASSLFYYPYSFLLLLLLLLLCWWTILFFFVLGFRPDIFLVPSSLFEIPFGLSAAKAE